MKYITIMIIIYLFIKQLYYGMYELKEKQNKPGGLFVLFIAILGLIFPISTILIFY